MRRFELVEGTSSKFWEIDLKDTGFSVRWGRIGTQGQAQEKSFASTAAAKTEHDKLVAEKLKKGYHEVGGTASPAPAPAPAPKKRAAPAKPAPTPEPATESPAATTAPPAKTTAPAPAAPGDDAPIAWDDALLRRVLPRRGGLAVPTRPLATPKKSWPAVRELGAALIPLLEEGLGRTELPELTSAVIARLRADEPAVGPIEHDAALVAVLEHLPEWNSHSKAEPLADLLFALGGPAHATQAVLQSFRFHLPRGDNHKLGPYVLNSGFQKTYWTRFGRGRHRTTLRLRALLATAADDQGYAAALAAAAPQSDVEREAAVFMFPTEQGWIDQLLAKPTEDTLLVAAAAASTPQVLDALGGQVALYQLQQTEWDLVPTVLAAAGAQSIGFFRAMQAGVTRSSSEVKRLWAEAVSRINSDEALALLLDTPEKEVLSFAGEAAARWPRRAVRLIAPRAAVRGEAGAGARMLLAQLVRRAPAAVDAELAGLTEDGRRAIAALRDSAGPDVPDAEPAQLPPVLAAPPWAQARKAAELPVREVTPRAQPDAMAWQPGERDAWKNRRGGWDAGLPSLSEKEIRARYRDQGRVLNAAIFAFGPDDLARPMLATYGFDRWSDDQWFPAMVGRYELDALPALLRAGSGPELIEALAPFEAPSVAVRIAEAYATSKKSRQAARAWLLRHPRAATTGLLGPALGRAGKGKDQACDALRLIAAASPEHKAQILETASAASPPSADAVEQLLSFDPLLRFPARVPKLPAWADPAALPRPLLADRSARLPVAAAEALLTMLAFSSADTPYVGLAQAKDALEPASTARFGWALFEAWLTAGAPSKEGWAFQALGPLGDDETARKLAPLIRQWPGEAAHARAVSGLDVLATIGTDVTLIYLNGIAEKVKFKGLQAKAQEKIAQIAEARGLTRDELADRLVPDLGLDDAGTLELDFGERRFTVGFDEQLRPFVKDSEGARLKDLPKPTKKDDEQKAPAAEERWKALKKDAKAAAGIQVMRLELGMCGRRRWPASVFRQFFVEHPLLIHVVRRLIWGVYDANGKLGPSFRVAEDRTFADANDDAFTFTDDATIGIPHALELDAASAAAWGQVLADYQLLQPFPQLGRPTYAPTPEEKKGSEITRVQGLKLPTGKVLGLETRGWRRGPAQDGGVAGWMEKVVGEGREVQLDLEPGLFTGMLSESPEQTLGPATFRTPNSWGKEGRLPLAELDPILFSELVRDLEGLR